MKTWHFSNTIIIINRAAVLILAAIFSLVLRPLHTESEIFTCVFQFFHIAHPFLSKCMQRMRKRRKSNLIWIFFDGRKFGGSVQTWLTQREVVFIS